MPEIYPDRKKLKSNLSENQSLMISRLFFFMSIFIVELLFLQKKLMHMRLLFLAFFIFSAFSVFSQANDPVLFTVDNDEVRLSEFQYIYEKNNSADADYSKKSLEEYLELYKRFKLKVRRAKEIGLDTVQTLKDELAGYRKQLAKSYLKDKEIADKLVDEVMTRMETDVQVEHIFVSAEEKAAEATKKQAKEKIENIHSKLMETDGKGFAEMAKTLSEDKLSAPKGGKLGYYTSPLPDGFYEFENAMYNAELGEIKGPVKSKMGWHILRVTDRRPARGEMEIAHILVRKNKSDREIARERIDTVYSLLEQGRNFETMAAKFSEDTKSKSNGGYLGYFKINQYEKAFEDAAFGLSEDGAYSLPVETELGFHIIKRISKRDNSDKDRLKKRIQARINNNDRFNIAEQKMIDDVKNEAGFTEDMNVLNKMINGLDDSFYSYKWQVPDMKDNPVLFTLAGKPTALSEFAQYCKSNVRERLKFNRNTPLAEAAKELYKAFVNEKVLAYEEANLEQKYPDFKALMREYREGILLFEITKQEVWDKASSDTAGLKKFFDKGLKKYMWPERVAVYKYTIKGDDVGAVSVYSYAQKKDHDKIVEKYGKHDQVGLSFEELVLEKSSELIKDMPLEKYAVTSLSKLPKPASFYAFKELVPPQEKTLEEARGYVIADYQDYLEEEWVDALEKAYPVEINNKVLNSIVKK